MTRAFVPALCLLVLVAAVSCDGNDGPSSTATPGGATSPSGTAATTAPATTPTSPLSPANSATAGAFAPIGANPDINQKSAGTPGGPQAMLKAVRSASHPEGWDRVVLEFSGSTVPESTVAYASGATSCGSGLPVQVPGQAVLIITTTNTVAHDEMGASTVTLPTTPTDLVAGMAFACDFEGVVSIAAGLAAPRPFVVGTLPDPPRLVIDMAH